MTIITDFEASKFGIITKHEKMQNGEYRFRLLSKDGSSYIRTESSGIVEWQNSHYHSKIQEIYIVQKGWMAFAENINGGIILRIFNSNEIVLSQPNIVHNVYLSPYSIIHTVKFGNTSETDWNASPEFDDITKKLSEEDILNLAKSSGTKSH